MPVLRDIVARLGMKFDNKGFKKADKSIGGLKKGIGGLGLAMAGVAAGIGAIKLVNLGSDAQEALNVMNFAFEENTEKVKKWAETFGKAAGRSEFELRKTASTLGAVLNPLMDQNAEAAANMAMGLAQISVDLGSFFDVADKDVLVALRSGLVGEMEPMRRFGVVMTQDALSAFALSKGLNSNIQAMSIAEKTALRYSFIMDQTAIAQGDAVRTSKNWANATKALGGSLHEVGTNIGLRLLPVAERVVLWLVDLAKGFSSIVKKSEIVNAALVVLGAVAAGVALKMLIAFAPIILKFVLIGAAIALVVLLVEDFLVMLQGGESVIGKFIDSIFGPGSAEAAVQNLKTAFEGLNLYWEDQLEPAIGDLGLAFGWLGDDIMDGLSSKVESLIGFFKDLEFYVRGIGRDVAEFFGLDPAQVEKDFDDTLNRLNARAAGVGGDILGGINSGNDNVALGGHAAGVRREERENRAILKKNMAGGIAPQTRAGRNMLIETASTLEVNITGMSDERAAKKVAKAIKDDQKASNKSMMKALKQGAE